MMDWTLDFFFGREIEQMVTFRDAEAIADRLARIHERTIQMNLNRVSPIKQTDNFDRYRISISY